ncbi:flagellar protein FlaG [Paenibacillus marinisediminis]
MNEIHRYNTGSIDFQRDKAGFSLPRSINTSNMGNILPQLGKTDLEPYSESDKKQVELALRQLNKTIKTSGTEIRLKYHEEAEQIVVELLDQASREVIATSPAEYLLELSIRMKEMVGVFLDEKV